MTRAFVFPGQGSQAVAMGKDFYDTFPMARTVFDEVDAILSPLYGHKLSTIIFEGPSETLTQTIYAQAALMTTSIAIYRVLEDQFKAASDKPFHTQASFMAGHSLGEYSALCAAGVLSLRDTAYLLYHRGKSMSESVVASNDEEGSPMAALMGLDIEVIERITKETECYIANDNGGGQIVLSGAKSSIARAMELAQSTGAKRVVALNVSAPFHCPLMQSSADVMAEKLNEVTFNDASTPIVTNVSAIAQTEGATFKKHLLDQICGRVRWRESVLFMTKEGVTESIEIGAGKVLTGLSKRIAPEITSFSINAVSDLEGLSDKGLFSIS